MQTLYITHPACSLHEMGRGHPESPERLAAINDRLLASGIMDLLQPLEARPASDADIARVHDRPYLDFLRQHAPLRGHHALDPDTALNAHTLDAAFAAAGAGITAVDEIMQGRAGKAFCAVRPPGHHARPAQAMGFCFFNNVAVAAAYAMHEYGLKRVGIVDFDVHHGNGTEEMFAGDERVLMCGFFQHPLYPGPGSRHPAANMLNMPLPAYSDGRAVAKVVEEIWLPRLNAFRPELLFISAGFDAHREDELAQLGLVEHDYERITEQLLEVAERHSGGRVISMLEGGYNLSALGRSVAAHIKALASL